MSHMGCLDPHNSLGEVNSCLFATNLDDIKELVNSVKPVQVNRGCDVSRETHR